jgi:uncharacterized protein YlbG (UPF0298 family)
MGKYCIFSSRHKKQLHFFDTLHSHSKQNKYICCVKKGIKLGANDKRLVIFRWVSTISPNQIAKNKIDIFGGTGEYAKL